MADMNDNVLNIAKDQNDCSIWISMFQEGIHTLRLSPELN